MQIDFSKLESITAPKIQNMSDCYFAAKNNDIDKEGASKGKISNENEQIRDKNLIGLKQIQKLKQFEDDI